MIEFIHFLTHLVGLCPEQLGIFINIDYISYIRYYIENFIRDRSHKYGFLISRV